MDNFIIGSGIIFLVPFFTTIGVAAPLKSYQACQYSRGDRSQNFKKFVLVPFIEAKPRFRSVFVRFFI